MNMETKMTSDMILKSDRAMAPGDYATAEIYNKQMLQKTFPYNTPLSLVYIHFSLSKIYYTTERINEARFHCNYCVENRGATALKSEAANMVKET